MSRINPNLRQPPPAQPPKEKPKGLRQRKPMRRIALDTAKEKRANDQMSAAFLRYNPECACGCGAESASWHHMASGSAGKEASRYDPDLALPAGEFCNSSEVFHDPNEWPKERQLAQKICIIMAKYNKATTTPVEFEKVIALVPADWVRVAELLQQRNGG